MTKYISSDEDDNGPLYLAKRVSEKSKMRYKLGAILVGKNQRVVVKAHNVPTVNRFYGSAPFFALHAEAYVILKAIRKLKTKDLSKYTLYVYRKNGNNAKPCKNCRSLIEMFGVKRVIYSNKVEK